MSLIPNYTSQAMGHTYLPKWRWSGRQVTIRLLGLEVDDVKDVEQSNGFLRTDNVALGC